MDIESSEMRPLFSHGSSSSRTSLDDLSGSCEAPSVSSSSIRMREVFAWVVISIQAFALAVSIQHSSPQIGQSKASFMTSSTSHPSLSFNNKQQTYYENQFLQATTSENPSGNPFYDPPTLYPPAAGLVSRVWHSNGSPMVNDGLKTGSCWCSGDDYCMCTPALAIDLVLTSGPDHVWLVRRKVGGKMALMGGFTEVGETVEEASRRELKEEMNIELPDQPLQLFGVYSDPKRDSRKHAVSVVFHLDVPIHINPNAGDDASEVVRIPLSSVEDLDMFIDHKTVIRDFIKTRERQRSEGRSTTFLPLSPSGDGEPFKRSVCDFLTSR